MDEAPTPVIAVLERSATFRRGLRAVLEESGFAVAEPSVDDTPDLAGVSAAIVTVESEGDLVLVSDVRSEAPEVPVVALVQDTDLSASIHALRAGCASVLPWKSEPLAIVAAVDAVLHGLSTMSPAVAAELASRMRLEAAAVLDKREAGWLQSLADGKTVSHLAEQVGYSEREMFRLLGELYRRLGAANRSEALVKAARLGVFDD